MTRYPFDPRDIEGFGRTWHYLHWGAWSDVVAANGPNPWQWTPPQTQYWIARMTEIDEDMILSVRAKITDPDELERIVAEVRPDWPGWQADGASAQAPTEHAYEEPQRRIERALFSQ